MKLFYNDTALHALGRVTISEQQTTPDPAQTATPQRWRRRMTVKVWFPEAADSWADRRALYDTVDRAVARPGGTLLWQDDNERELLNQEVEVAGHDWPSDPNEKHSRRLQQVTLTLAWWENLEPVQTQTAQTTYQRTGSATVLTLGQTETCREEKTVTRYSPLLNHRESSVTALTLTGKFVGNPRQEAATRRVAVLTQLTALRGAITEGSSGTLTYAAITEGATAVNRAVRVEAFTAEIDQPNDQIAWSLTVRFTDFPNESNYAQAQFEVVPRTDQKTGRKTLLLSGEILANSVEAADAKLAALRDAHGAGYRVVSSEPRYQRIDGADGAAFVKLTFSEEYEPATDGVTAWELRQGDTEDAAAGWIRRSYTGFVEAMSAASFDAAYQVATTRARQLGAHKAQMLVSGTLTGDDAQQSSERQVTGDYRCRVEFSYEYRLRGASRTHIEITSALRKQTFGTDEESVQGTVSAATIALAREAYATIKAGFSATAIRDEQVSEQRFKMTTDASASTGAKRTPPGAGEWGGVNSPTVNADEVADGTEATDGTNTITAPPGMSGMVRQTGSLSFSFTVHRAKTGDVDSVATRYEIETVKDWARGQLVRSIPNGVIWAASLDVAERYLAGFLPSLGLGTVQAQLRLAESYERWPGLAADVTTAASTFLAYAFSASYVSVLTGGAQIREAKVSEEIEMSGTRIVVRPTAISNDVAQECGTQSGRRTVSGEVTALNEAVALAWCRTLKSLPLADGDGVGATSTGWVKELPGTVWAVEPEMLPLVEPIPRSGDWGTELGTRARQHVMGVRVRFRFAWVHENLRVAGL